MEVDGSGWRDIDERLGALTMAGKDCETLTAHLASCLVGHFGADSVECHLGKNDPQRHSMREVAAAALAHLGPLLELLPEDAVASLVESGTLGATTPPPWDEEWRSQPRTASWRS